MEAATVVATPTDLVLHLCDRWMLKDTELVTAWDGKAEVLEGLFAWWDGVTRQALNWADDSAVEHVRDDAPVEGGLFSPSEVA